MSTGRKPRAGERKLGLASFRLEDQLARATDLAVSTSWPHTGRTVGFPLLSDRLDGMKNALYALAGASRMGKSTFALQVAFQVVRDNPDTHALFFSLDQPARDLNIRLVAMAGEVPVDFVINPDPAEAERYDEKRQRGVEKIFELRERFTLVDESLGGLSLTDLKGFVEEKRQAFKGPLVVFLDPYYKLRVDGVPDFHSRVDVLTQELKTLCMSQEVGVFCTTRLAHAAGHRRPTLEDLEEQTALLYEAQVILLSYCDFYNNADTSFMEWEWGSDDLMVPIYEVKVAKNKMGGFAGRIYFRFYNSFSKFKECPQVEIDNYDKMLHNLTRKDSDSPAHDSMPHRYEVIDDK